MICVKWDKQKQIARKMLHLNRTTAITKTLMERPEINQSNVSYSGKKKDRS
jgi:hypothetical protein